MILLVKKKKISPNDKSNFLLVQSFNIYTLSPLVHVRSTVFIV